MIEVFSLAETMGTNTGLGGYAVLRGMLWPAPYIIIIGTCMHIVWAWLKSNRQGELWWPLLGYLSTSIVILIAFWPEAVKFEHAVSPVASSEVVSQVALANGAPIQSAAQVLQDTSPLGSFSLVPDVFHTILEMIVSTPIMFAQTLHDSAMRPFAATMPLNWLLRHKLDSDTLGAVHDWVDKCVLPAKARLLATGTSLTYESTLPFGSSALVDAMAQITVAPARGGFLSFFQAGTPVRCDTYGTQIEDRVITAIIQAQTPGAQSLAAVWEEELGISATDAARMLVYREILATAGPEIPAPSLMAQYAIVRGITAVGSAIGSTLGLSRLFGPGPVAGLAGSAVALGNELGRALDALSGLIGPALFVTIWAPEMLGLIQLVMLSLFPFVLLWSLIRGQHIRPLFVYFSLLFVVYSSPIWWAAIGLFAASLGDIQPSPIDNPQEWLRLSMGILIVQTIGIPIVAGGIATVVAGFAGGGVFAVARYARGQQG